MRETGGGGERLSDGVWRGERVRLRGMAMSVVRGLTNKDRLKHRQLRTFIDLPVPSN